MESEQVLHRMYGGVNFDVCCVLNDDDIGDDGNATSSSLSLSSSSTWIIPLEIEFEGSEKDVVHEFRFSEGRVIGPLRESPGHVISRHQCTINDIRWCSEPDYSETTADVKLRLSPVLSLFGIAEDTWDSLAGMIVRPGRRRIAALDDDSTKLRLLRMRARVQRVNFLFPCEGCAKQRDALIMESLKRVRVRVAGPEEEEEEEKEGRERKRRRVVVVVVPESESCPICLEEFNKGSDDDDVSCTPCSHVFHCKCIGKWLKGGHYNCPYCRSEIMPRIDLASIIRGRPSKFPTLKEVPPLT